MSDEYLQSRPKWPSDHCNLSLPSYRRHGPGQVGSEKQKDSMDKSPKSPQDLQSLRFLRSPQILHDMEAVSTRGANVTPKPFVLLLRAPVRRVNVLLQLVHTLEQLRKNAGMRGSYPPKMRQKNVVLFTFLGWFSMVFCASVCQYYLTGRICQQLDQIEQVDDWVWALKQSDRKINKSCSRVFGIHPNRKSLPVTCTIPMQVDKDGSICRWRALERHIQAMFHILAALLPYDNNDHFWAKSKL